MTETPVDWHELKELHIPGRKLEQREKVGPIFPCCNARFVRGNVFQISPAAGARFHPWRILDSGSSSGPTERVVAAPVEETRSYAPAQV